MHAKKSLVVQYIFYKYLIKHALFSTHSFPHACFFCLHIRFTNRNSECLLNQIYVINRVDNSEENYTFVFNQQKERFSKNQTVIEY